MRCDIVVIGAGPGGYAAAVRAAGLGARTVLVEKNKVGGTCLHRGCIPTKTLAYSAALRHNIERAAEFGISAGDVSVDFKKLLERKNKVVMQLAKGINYLINKNKITLINGHASLAAPGEVRVATADNGEVLIKTDNVIIATGTEPALDPVMGYDGKLVLTSNEILDLDYVPRELLIIGGGVVGCEFACIFNALGARVTILEITPEILPGVDREIVKTLQGLLKRQGIVVKTKINIAELRKSDNTVTALLDSGEEIGSERVLLSVGRQMQTDGLGLAGIGVSIGRRGEIIVNDKMQTGVSGIYAVGDITGKSLLAHVASAQGMVAADNILGKEREMDYRVTPSCIFTLPEVAGVGLTSQEAAEKGLSIKTGKFFFAANPKAQIIGDTGGFVKIIAGETDGLLLGVHIIGPQATELIAEAALAIRCGIPAGHLVDTMHAHPTLSEAMHGAADTVFNRP